MYYGISILPVGKQYNVLWYFHTTGRKAVECTTVKRELSFQQDLLSEFR